ncbi:MAG TPA: serine hydrolase domain-containing protein [Chitinophagaceae bacterium]|nr:serine hydrolase domain-containing protein [Chitinophagaceae bacterium]
MKYIYLLLLLAPFETTAQLNKATTMAFHSIFQTFFKPDEPGGAALVVRDNKIIYLDGFGIADINTKSPINTKTLFNVGSISKTFVACGILKLAEEGNLSLADDLYKYFPDFKNAAIAKKIKLYHLLTHTSGIPDSRPVKEQHEFYLTAKDEENFAPLKQTDTLQFKPGTQYRYSNPAFNGLALIIEKVTGKKWQQYISENIFKPAGMTTSTITDGPHPETGVSHGYILNDGNVFEELDYGEEPTFAAAGNGGVWSSVEELWKYEQAIQQHKFFSIEWINKSRTVYPFTEWQDETPQRLGLSWFINKDSTSKSMIGHTGSQGGFISDYCWWPEEKIFYVLLCNIPKPILEIRKKVYELAKK